MVISCYSPTYNRDETDITNFYKRLYSFAQHINKHKVLIIDGDMNTQIGKDRNNKFCVHKLPNRNHEYLADFSLKNSFASQNSMFENSEGKLSNHGCRNYAKAYLDYIVMNKVWINSDLERSAIFLFWKSVFNSQNRLAKFALVYTEVIFKQSKLHLITDPHLPTVIWAINKK